MVGPLVITATLGGSRDYLLGLRVAGEDPSFAVQRVAADGIENSSLVILNHTWRMSAKDDKRYYFLEKIDNLNCMDSGTGPESASVAAVSRVVRGTAFRATRYGGCS